ncbi:hypothetical protein F5884DRAFT_904875 [Xylogone sp. PMI_703]|nr:hypothetical protein F5884DRAFT_904875 [Xylogone sp. PMI_703]
MASIESIKPLPQSVPFLPIDLLQIVIEHLSLKDLQAVRLVCKTFERCAVSKLFYHVRVWMQSQSLERLLNISRCDNIRQHVKRLSIGLELLETNAPSKSLFLQRLYHQNHPVPLSQRVSEPLSFDNIGWYTENRDWTPRLVLAAYNAYVKLIEEQKLFEETGMDSISLAAAFANLHNLQSVIIQSTNFGQINSDQLFTDVRELQNLILLCPYINQIFRPLDTGRIHFRNFLRAASVSSLKISELFITDDRRFVTPENLRVHPGDLLMCKKAVAHIRRLYIELPQYNHQGEYIAGYFENQLGVFIQSMPLLEDLTIIARSSSSYVPWLTTWEPFRIPLLRTISVQCIDFIEDDLFQYMERHAETLRVVELSAIEMRDGSFSSLFKRMRNTLNLERLTLSGIFQDIEGSYVYYSPGVMRAIEKFVTRRSPKYPYEEVSRCLYEQRMT